MDIFSAAASGATLSTFKQPRSTATRYFGLILRAVCSAPRHRRPFVSLGGRPSAPRHRSTSHRRSTTSDDIVFRSRHLRPHSSMHRPINGPRAACTLSFIRERNVRGDEKGIKSYLRRPCAEFTRRILYE